MIRRSPELKLLNSVNISNLTLRSAISFDFISWLRSNFCRAAAFVSVLMFGYNLVHYSILAILIVYFTNTNLPKNYHVVKAAMLVTFREGISASLGIFVAYMLDARFSRLKILSCAIASTILGLLIIIICGAHDWVNITAVILLAVGEAVRPQLKAFLADQLRGHEVAANTDKDPIKVRKRVWWIVSWLCSVAATFVISNYSWKIIFISSTLVLGGSFMLFLSGISYYHNKEFVGAGSNLFNFILVVKASLSKRHLNYPSSADLFYQNDGTQTHLSPQVKILRWMDKAAIKPSDMRQEERDRAGRLCTVTQVKDSKLLLKMIPMWTTFLVFGLVASTGDNFSSEQGSELARTDFTFYVVIFLKAISHATLSYLFGKFSPSERVPEAQHKLAKILRIWSGMVLSTVFCAVAWRVEVRRLHTKTMSIFWLAPQYCLLGLMESCSADGLDKFMSDELPKSMENYASAMNTFVIDGIGSFLSIFFMHANRSLFDSTLETSGNSRLDQYYMRLMIISFVNMCYYCVISTIYGPMSYPEAEMVERVSKSKLTNDVELCHVPATT